MSAIDKVLFLLKDGNWHTLKEITEKVSLSKSKLEKVAVFLKEYGFIKLNRETKDLKIQSTIRKFLEEIEALEKNNLNKQDSEG